MDQIGHTDPAFTQRLYTHLFEDDREAAGVNLAELFPSASLRLRPDGLKPEGAGAKPKQGLP